MRILHTADWHVGKRIRGHRRDDEHRAVLVEIVQIAQNRHFDLILVAGDQFDSSTPSAESEKTVYSTLLDLADTGAQVIVIAGNHDNAEKLEAVGPLLARADVTVASRIRRPEEGGVLNVKTQSGLARVVLFPFLSKRKVVSAAALMDKDSDDHQQSYQDRITRLLQVLCRDFEKGDAVNIVLGHLTVVGANPGGGERIAHIFDYFVPANVFPETAHYVALGHIHNGQKIPGPCPTYYAGAPLALDFGDKKHKSRVLDVKAKVGQPATVESIPLTAGRPLKTLKGTLSQLEAQRDSLGDAYIRLLLDDLPRPGLAEDARELFPSAVDIRVKPKERNGSPSPPADGDVGGFFEHYLKTTGHDPTDLIPLFNELYEDADRAGSPRSNDAQATAEQDHSPD